MTHAIYIGADYVHLQGKGALVQPLPGAPECFMVQFDDRSLTLSGKSFDWESPNSEIDAGDPPLAFGWHPFRKSDFNVDE